MIWEVTNREEKNQDDQQPQASLFQHPVSGVCTAENDDHMRVAAQCDEERDTESSECQSKAVF